MGDVTAPFTATWPTPIFPLRLRWLLLYIYFSVGNRQSFRTHFLHNYSDGDIYSMFFRVSSIIIPSIYSPQFSAPRVWSTTVDFPCVYFVYNFPWCLTFIFPYDIAQRLRVDMRVRFSVLVSVVCSFSVALVFYSALWYAPDVQCSRVDYSVVERRQSVYQFSVHAPNLQSLIKRFIFRFKGIFSVPRLRTKGYRLSSRVRHLSS